MSRDVDIKGLSLRQERAATAAVPPRRHVLARYVFPALLIGGFAALTGWSARDAWLPRQPVTVVPVYVTRAEFQAGGTPLFNAAAWVEPRPTPIRVAALAPGVVEELLVVEDQRVAAGEPIARLISIDAELALAQAEAHLCILQSDVEIAQAALAAATTNLEVPAHLEVPVAEAEAQLREIEAELSNLPNQVVRARARLRLAEIDVKAKEKAGVAVTVLQLEQAQAEYDFAQAEVRELTERLPVIRKQRDALANKLEAARTRLELKTDEVQARANAEARLAAAKAHVVEAEVAVKAARLRLDRMTIKAPVSGRILDLVATPGAQMMEGWNLSEGRDSNTVVTMYCPDQLQVRADVRFEDLPQVGRDQPVEIRSPALPEPLHGRVLFLTGFANIQKNTLEVKVSLDDPPDVLKPEMLVDVTFLAPERQTADEPPGEQLRLFIPRSLLKGGDDGRFVWIVDSAEGVARRQRVTLGGAQTPTLVEIATGLDASSRLIASGRQGLTDGARIEIQGEEPAEGFAQPDDSGEQAHLTRHPQ